MTHPTWYQEAVFYHIFPIAFCGAPEFNDGHSEPVERLLKILDWIPHFQELGVTALYLGPIFESVSHGYDTVDYFNLDRRLGTNQTLKTVINSLHEHGINVVLDAVLNHVSRGFFAFKDLQSNLEQSQYCSWFKGLDFKRQSPEGDRFSYEGWSGHYNLVKLNLKEAEVEQHLLAAVRYWIETFQIDGLRLDAADVMDFGFLKNLTAFTQSLKKDFWLMGEVVHGDYTHWANPEMLHATTNYECYKGLYSSHNDKNYFELAHSLNRLFESKSGLYKDLYLYNFADNHDVDRVASSLKHSQHLYPLYLLLFTMPGIPSIYYGSEWELKGAKTNGSDAPMRPDLDLEHLNQSRSGDLKDAISRFSALRKQSEALKHGGYQPIHVASEQIVFLRATDSEQTLIAVNAAQEAVTVQITLPKPGGHLKDRLNQNQIIPIQGKQVTLEIPAGWGRVLEQVA